MTGRVGRDLHSQAPARRRRRGMVARLRLWPAVLGMTLCWASPCWPTALLATEYEPTPPEPTRLAIRPESPTVTGIRPGFAGRFKVGYWTPFEITLQGGNEEVSGSVELTALDGDAVPSRVCDPSGQDITIRPGEKTAVLLYAKVGRLHSDLTVGFRSQDRLLASRTFSTVDNPQLGGILPSDWTLIVAFGSPLSAEDETSLDERGAKVANVNDLGQLPTNWLGYEGVDTVILATVPDQTNAQLASHAAQLAALDRWVTMGGQLILSVGPQADKVLTGESPLARLAPGEFEALVPLRQSTAFETYAETSEPLTTQGGAFALQVPKLRNVRGKIEAYAGSHARDLPLIVRAPHGFGEVVFVAFDLQGPPLAGWRGRAQLFDKLLGRSAPRVSQDESQGLGQVTTLGFDDLSGQLRGALDQFAGVELVPFWLVALLAVAYIVCIGPLDYFIIKRVLGRMELTWLTFAVTVVAFSAGAYALTYGLKGREVRVNRIDLVDFDAETRLVRGTSWAAVFSPKVDLYDLSLGPRVAAEKSPVAAGLVFSWLGLPGSGFGGMDATGSSTPMFTEAYDFSHNLERMQRVPIADWSSKAFVGRWWQSGTPAIEAQLSDTGRLVGTLNNRSQHALEDCVLFYERWAYPLRQLRPDQTIAIETDLDPQRVETYLRRVTVQGDRNVALPYDRASFDIAKIVEIMTSHSLAGGEKYTGLAHKYQGFVELSGLVQNGRAVLVGRSAGQAATLQRDAQPLVDAAGAQWTFQRYVFGVQDRSSP